jgi:hypothetical protein
MIELGKSFRAGAITAPVMALAVKELQMQIRLSQQRPSFRLIRRRFLVALFLIAALVVAIRALFPLQPDSISAVTFLFLPLVLFAALGAGREPLTPSLTELAFYSFAVVAALAIWPSARLAVTAYEATGFVTLIAFMAFVIGLAIGLGVVTVKLLAGNDGEK